MAQLRSARLRQKWDAAGLSEASDADRSVVISTGNSLDMWVPVAWGKGGMLACICLWRGGRGGMLGTAVMRWQFQCTGWPREIRLPRGKENKWACHRRDVSCLLNMNAYSKYVALRQAFVFSIKSLDLLFRAVGTRARQRFLHITLRFNF